MTLKLTSSEKIQVRSLRKSLTNIELFNHINAQRSLTDQFGYTTFRTEVYKLKLFKCKMTRWTAAETKFLLDNYKTKGNTEIAKLLSKNGRKFTKAQVSKKNILEGITRTKEELQQIVEFHKKRGTYHKANLARWKTMKVAEGKTTVQVKKGRPQVSIKVNGILKAYSRVRYAQLYGEIEKGAKIYFKDMNPLNTDDSNLIARKGCGLTSEERQLYKKNCEAYIKGLTAPPLTTERVAEHPKMFQQKLISVRINARTVISVKPGTNIEKLKERYASRTMIN